ncbi:MAG: flagellar basal body P-ring formation chaperone FlgA [Motiliproteus sp.]
MLKGSLILTAWLLLWAGSHTAQAVNLSLSEQAQAYLSQQLQSQLDPRDQLQIRVRMPDSRLQLEPCANAVTFSTSRSIQAGSFSLKANCDYPRRWSRYLQGEIQILRQVLISTRPLSKGHRLQARDMRLKAVDKNSLREGSYTQAQQILDYQLNRSVAGNIPLTPKLLSPPVLIQKGDTVTIQAGSNGIHVEMAGTALEAGTLSQQIAVKNNQSERVIKATVIGYGKVKVRR